MNKDKSSVWKELLWKLLDERNWLWENLDLVLIGAMLSISLIQFSVDGWSCVPSLLFGLRPNYGWGNGDLLQMNLGQHYCIQCPWLCGRRCQPLPPTETPGHSQASLVQSFVGSLLLFPGSWCPQGFICAFQESVSLVLWKFCNQIPLASKVKFTDSKVKFTGKVPLPDPPVRRSVVSSRTFTIVQYFLLYNSSPVCGSSAQWLYGGANGNLLQEDLHHPACLPGLLKPEPLSPGRALLTRASAGDTQTLESRSGSVSVGSPGPSAHKVLFEPSKCLWWIRGFDFKHDFAPPTILLGFLLCPWMWGIFFWWNPTLSGLPG